MSEIIYNQEITDELFHSFLDYSMSVITDRALPDVRSGLKPIHTKIIYAANELGLKSDKPFKKSAKLVGSVIGEYSPHGDEATYQAIVKLVQDFYLRYPLMSGEGNWGTSDGDEAAAYRYTLCKLSKYGELMLEGIKNNAVDFKPTFSNESIEPIVLPALFPNLICNGTSGIAVGMATKLAPHNLTEVCNAIIAYLKNNDITIKELMNYVQGPDFPTGGIVINKSSLLDFYSCGKGSIKIQSVYHFQKNGKYTDIIFTEVPYGVSKERVTEKISTLCSKGELNNIIDVHDDTTFRTGINYVITTSLKEEEDLERLVNMLFDKTDLESSFSINQNVIINGHPQLVNFKEMIEHYCIHQKDVLTRVTQSEKDKLLISLEKLNGLLIALASIEDIIKIIKQSESRNNAKTNLIAKYNFTELQADTILDMKLSRLTKIDGVEIKNKQQQIANRLKELDNILLDKNVLTNALIDKILFMKKNYGDDRRTKIIDKIREKKSSKKDIVDENTTVLITAKGEIKRINNYKKTGIALINAIQTSSLSTICIFTEDGVCNKIPVKKIPLILKNSDKGGKLSDFNINQKIIFSCDINKLQDILIITKKGFAKILPYTEINSNRNVKFITLKDNDSVIYINTGEKKKKVITNIQTRVIDNILVSKRTAIGSKAKDWKEEEFIEKI